ncbi:hypothetical protein [Microbacterium bovistercoris]|uniref:hypothetical protein n=1 Tax=Microbacterium bovistercoris TaxID=2293570 RepID=UPI0015F27AD9|nr:hypothetical protein [Microbacterium bovistercoris]
MIAVASAVPRAAASVPVDPCIAVPTGTFYVTGGALMEDGAAGVPASSNGLFGTGWTPPQESTQNPDGTWSQTNYAVDPEPASWWQTGGASPSTEVGFLSLDDNDNSDGSSGEPSVVTGVLTYEVTAGTPYTFAFPIYASADYLGCQYLSIDISGPGVEEPGAVQGYFGNPAITDVPEGVDAYPHFSETQSPEVTFTPTSSGTLTFTYTFTVAHVTGGERKNADLFVKAPLLTNCG